MAQGADVSVGQGSSRQPVEQQGAHPEERQRQLTVNAALPPLTELDHHILAK